MKWSCSLSIHRISLLVALLAGTRVVQAQAIEKFDVPGASNTYPRAVNEFGRIAGSYEGADRVSHGFVRSPFGTFVRFDAPNPGDDGTSANTVVSAINAAGQVVGGVYAGRGGVLVERGFVRDEHGTITAFDAVSTTVDTEAQAINVHGWIAGTYHEGNEAHGFVRSPRGTITTFDTPESIALVREIRPNGTVIGVYQKPIGFFHGFVREPNGTVSTIDGPDLDPNAGGVACSKCGGTFTTAASATGRIVGFYAATGGVLRGFLRDPDGSLSNLDVPGARRTEPEAVNLEGSVAGEYTNPDSYDTHGFLRFRNGTLESFDVSGANFLIVTAIDSGNRVIGYFADTSGVHGFIRKPRRGCGHFGF